MKGACESLPERSLAQTKSRERFGTLVQLSSRKGLHVAVSLFAWTDNATTATHFLTLVEMAKLHTDSIGSITYRSFALCLD